MNKNILNKNGTAFIGLLVSVLAIAMIFVGSFYFYNGRDANNADVADLVEGNVVDVYKSAQDDVAEINKNIEERNSKLEESVSSDNDMIKVFNIKNNDTVSSPLKIIGEGIAFDNTLIVELRNSERGTMVKEFVTTKAIEVGTVGSFEITLHFEFDNTKEGYIVVYEESAEDGSEQNLLEIPVKFN